ncbi:MAG: enoyl-CoA hydratase-related protein [Pseudomonadota bacterium]
MLDEATPHLRSEKHDGVMTLTIDRVEKKNAMTQDMYLALAAGLQAADDDAEVGAAILTGAGGVFTAGNDLKDFLAAGIGQGPGAAMKLLDTVATIDVPLVAAVEGPAIGIGATILLHCDYAYAGPTALFKTPFVDLALCPEGASTLLMPEMIGKRATNDFLMLGKAFSAEEAAACGLVSGVAADPLTTAMETAKALAAKPRDAQRATKRLIRQARGTAVTDTFSREAKVFAERLVSDEARAVFQQFFARG